MAGFADRVRETSTTAGTGALTLLGAVSDYQTFASAFALNQIIRYAIANGLDAGGSPAWEVGTGYLSAANVLVRDVVLSSSAAGALINWDGSSRDVFCSLPSEVTVDNGIQFAMAVFGYGLP